MNDRLGVFLIVVNDLYNHMNGKIARKHQWEIYIPESSTAVLPTDTNLAKPTREQLNSITFQHF